MSNDLENEFTRGSNLEGFTASRFHVIVTRNTPSGPDAWTEEWFSKKATAIEFARRFLNGLPGGDRDTIGWTVLVYDSQVAHIITHGGNQIALDPQGNQVECDDCQGGGIVAVMPFDGTNRAATCPTCDGRGWGFNDGLVVSCTSCEGDTFGDHHRVDEQWRSPDEDAEAGCL